MTHDPLWLLALVYIECRAGYPTARFKFIFDEIAVALDASGRLTQPVANTTDSDIREAFKPVEIVKSGKGRLR